MAESPSGSSRAHTIVYVHFPSTLEEVHEEYYIYEADTIVAAVGGALGLFLGFSCLKVLLRCLRWGRNLETRSCSKVPRIKF